MNVYRESGGLMVVRSGPDRATSWDGRIWQVEYLQAGAWHRYPLSVGSDPTGGDLYSQGVIVWNRLAPAARHAFRTSPAVEAL
jgi:hypothetical protein